MAAKRYLSYSFICKFYIFEIYDPYFRDRERNTSLLQSSNFNLRTSLLGALLKKMLEHWIARCVSIHFQIWIISRIANTRADINKLRITMIVTSGNSICIDPRNWIFHVISRCNGVLAILLVEKLQQLIFTLDASHEEETYIPISTVKNVLRGVHHQLVASLYNTWACQISVGDYFVLLFSRPRMRDTYLPIPDVIILYIIRCMRAIHVLYRSKIFFELWRISYKILSLCVYGEIQFIRNPP